MIQSLSRVPSSFAKSLQRSVSYHLVAFSADLPITCTIVSDIYVVCTLLERLSCGLKTVDPAKMSMRVW